MILLVNLINNLNKYVTKKSGESNLPHFSCIFQLLLDGQAGLLFPFFFVYKLMGK